MQLGMGGWLLLSLVMNPRRNEVSCGLEIAWTQIQKTMKKPVPDQTVTLSTELHLNAEEIPRLLCRALCEAMQITFSRTYIYIKKCIISNLIRRNGSQKNCIGSSQWARDPLWSISVRFCQQCCTYRIRRLLTWIRKRFVTNMTIS